MNLPDRRYLTWGAALIIVASLPVLAGLTRPGWEFSEISGLAATLACLALCGCPVRPRESNPPVLLAIGRHEALGWLAAGTAALHVVAALAADHTVVEYLKFTAPLYQLAGIAALLILLLLVATSWAGVRRRLWSGHRNFQATHVAFACLLAALLGAHVIASGRYAGGTGRRLAYIVAAAGGLAMLLRRRRIIGAGAHSVVVRRLAFGRHSTFIAGAIAAAIVALSLLIASRADVALREPLARRALTLPLNFDHGRHVAVNCLVCHHNYADGRGFDACIHCHRGGRADLKLGIEARFHSFCLNCHRNPDERFARHGPVSGCQSCHQPAAAST